MSTLASRQVDTARSIYYALGANVAIGASKLCGAVLTGSGTLLAESFHSLADTGNEVLLLLGRKQAKLRPSARHPLGHGREIYFWSFVVTILLFSVGGIFSIYEGVRKVYEPAAIEKPWIGVGILLFAMLAEGVSLRTVLRQVAKVRGERGLWSWFRETRRSELIVVLGEDLAAIAGLSVALPALLVTIATGNTIYDALGSVTIGVLLMIVASGLAIEIKSLLIGESASPRTRRAIRQFLNSRPQILEVGQLVTLQHGDDLIVAITAHMRDVGNGRELVRTIAECKAAIRMAFPQIRWIFFEPIDG